MQRLKWTAALGAVLTLGGGSSAAAQEQLAASCEPPVETWGRANPGSTVFAQSFWAQAGGPLVRAEMALAKFSTATAGDWIVEIRSVDGLTGEPNEILASATVSDAHVPYADEGNPATIPMSSATFATPATIVAGQVYAISVTRPASDYVALGLRVDDCLGQGWSVLGAPPWHRDSNADYVFRVFVTPPPPPVGDIDPPETEITLSVIRNSGKARFRFAADEADSTFECKLRGPDLNRKLRRFRHCEPPRKYKNLDQGRFKFKVRAVDAAGNVDPTPDRDRFRVVG